MDTNNYLNKVFPLFDRLHKELSFRFHLVDIFSNCFSFYIINYKVTNAKTACYNKLDKIYEEFFLNLNTILVISNTSIKNKVKTSILHI